ncbi:HEAT repeat domain-containing protein [Streptomyces sp. MBT62]|uniref:HEAT repeat domain-containing protein n=1 Tax=Streptomyces sp. MBT62 TaxID=2800410 RepID=UPI00190D9EB8|nr:HEAT repeat domain-containing protein [Streptomyces sp. MBT62]MBK3562161.1 HEAT repeat domain-containing protein [Streptomyces sp. MBT62]
MSDTAAQLDALAAELADPDCDFDRIEALESELLTARDTDLIPRLQEHLAGAVQAGNGYGRHVLSHILAATAGSRALPELLRAFARDLGDDQDSLTATVTVLARQDRAHARSIILRWATGPDPDPDPDLRRTALWLLGYVPEPDDLDLLADAARDPDDRVRSVTVGTIGSHTKTSARAVDLLKALLADPSPRVRVSALSTLGFARRPGTLPAIHRLAEDDSTDVRAWVAIALSRFPAAEPATLAVLDVLAHDPDTYVREKAVAAREKLAA